MTDKRAGAFDQWINEEESQGVDWSDVSRYADETNNEEQEEGETT